MGQWGRGLGVGWGKSKWISQFKKNSRDFHLEVLRKKSSGWGGGRKKGKRLAIRRIQKPGPG